MSRFREDDYSENNSLDLMNFSTLLISFTSTCIFFVNFTFVLNVLFAHVTFSSEVAATELRYSYEFHRALTIVHYTYSTTKLLYCIDIKTLGKERELQV